MLAPILCKGPPGSIHIAPLVTNSRFCPFGCGTTPCTRLHHHEIQGSFDRREVTRRLRGYTVERGKGENEH